MIRLILEAYRYFKYYQYDLYVSRKWLTDLECGLKNHLIVDEYLYFRVSQS